MKTIFTSESVTEGHPDKICDQISDAIVDEIIKNDCNARVACETIVTTNTVLVVGEISTTYDINIHKLVREVIKEIGYNSTDCGFDYKTCEIKTFIHEQSPDIALGVNNSLENKKGNKNEDELHGAGDQGMMFGYACDETPELMPLPISLSHKIAKKLSDVRKTGEINYLRPDGKTQVSVVYEDNKPIGIDTILISAQHNEKINNYQLNNDIIAKVIFPTIPNYLISKSTKILINPTGRFVVGGPHGDSGLTGRKIIVDTYGGYSRHGGGAFSGKDPTKVDRSAAYAARYIAKNIVAAGLAKKCEVQIAYAIGMAQPVSVLVDTFSTGIFSDEIIASVVIKNFNLKPSAIIRELNLWSPIYKSLAAYGHMGRDDLNVKWEKIDKAEELVRCIESLKINER